MLPSTTKRVMLTHLEEEKFDAAAFGRFLIDILQAYPQGKLVMVLDNAHTHHADEIQPY